jgi:hypothetical protein
MIPVVCQGFPLATVKPSLQTRDAIYGNIPRLWHGHDLRRNGVPAWEAESSRPGDATRDPRQLSLAVSCPRALDGRPAKAQTLWAETRHDDRRTENQEAALANGASGFLAKDAVAESLTLTIRQDCSLATAGVNSGGQPDAREET